MLPVLAAIVAFALLATVHVTLAISVARQRSGRMGLLAFLVVPLAPFLGWQSGKRGQSVLWVVFALVYAISLFKSLV